MILQEKLLTKAKNDGFRSASGPLIEKLSKEGNEHFFKFPRPLYKTKNPNFFFQD